MNGERKMTRKDWARRFNVPYPVLTDALRGIQPLQRMPGFLFDEQEVRDAMYRYYAKKRDSYQAKADSMDRLARFYTEVELRP